MAQTDRPRPRNLKTERRIRAALQEILPLKGYIECTDEILESYRRQP